MAMACDWSKFQVISLNPDGSLQRVRCKLCKWGDPKGVSANATRCRLHLETKHAPKPARDDPSAEVDLSEDDGLEEVTTSQSTSEDVPESPILKRKLVQTTLQTFGDRGFKVWQSDHATELLVKFKVCSTSMVLLVLFLYLLQTHFGLSYSCLDSDQFRAFARSLRVDYKVPGRKALQKEGFNMYRRCTVRVEQELKRWGHCAVCIDGWADHENLESVGCTAVQLGAPTKPILVEVEQQVVRQTAINLRGFLERAIGKVEVIVLFPFEIWFTIKFRLTFRF